MALNSKYHYNSSSIERTGAREGEKEKEKEKEKGETGRVSDRRRSNMNGVFKRNFLFSFFFLKKK